MSIIRVLLYSGLVFLLFTAIISCIAYANTINVPGDYKKIQDAIDAAQTGDTITVYSGTYDENVVIDKTLIVIGVNTGSGLPIVDGHGAEDAVAIRADDASLRGFNVTNAQNGIMIGFNSNYNTVTGNIIYNNTENGISIDGSSNNYIADNLFIDNRYGIESMSISVGSPWETYWTWHSDYNVIKNNTIINNSPYTIDGIFLISSDHTSMMGNTVNNSHYGIEIAFSDDCKVMGNSLNNCCFGVFIDYSSDHSNITNNTIHGNKYGIILNSTNNNVIINNYVDNNSEGIAFDHSDDNIVTGNCLIDNYEGISLNYSANNGMWLNVMEKNRVNGNVRGGSSNYWNSTIQNVYDYNGHSFTNYTGNYWGDSIGEDSNLDGISDKPLSIDNNNIDYYPMLRKTTSMMTPTPNSLDSDLFGVPLGIVTLVMAIYFKLKGKPK